MRTSKKALAVLLTTMCVVNLGAVNCSAEEAVTIDFWHHYSAQTAQNDTLMNVLIPKFEEENPGIKVNAVSYEWADQHQKMLVSAQSDTLPDVAHLDTAWVPEFQEMGILAALDNDIPEFESVSGSLLENAMDTAKIGNHYYGLALSINTKIMFCNKQALEDAGVKIPETMEEFVEAVMALSGTNENGQQVWGYEEPGLGGWNLCPFIWSMGGSLTNEEETQASGYINSPETVAAIQMLSDLNEKNAITGWNSGDIPMTDGFGTGRYAMIVDGPCNTENEEAAWKFAEFMTSAYAQEEMAKCGQVPANKEALESDTVKGSYFAPFLDAITTAKARPKVSCWTEMDSELSVAITAVMNGEKTAQEAMDDLAVTWDALLAE